MVVHLSRPLPLLMAGAFNPIGCLRIQSALQFYERQSGHGFAPEGGRGEGEGEQGGKSEQQTFERVISAVGIVGNVEFVLADAENLPFPDGSFHCVTIGFGLRNVTDKDAALRSMYRVLKPGGRLIVLEFSRAHLGPLAPVYEAYSFNVLPQLGKLLAGDSESYRYLAESIRKHPDQDTLKAMMESAGFERCTYFNLTAGIVAVHVGYRL